MFERLGRGVVTRRRWILIGALIFFLAAGVIGGGVADRLSNGGFEDPNSEATKAQQTLDREFGATSPNIVLLVTSKSGSVDDPSSKAAGLALTKELEGEPGVGQVISYW